MSPFVTLYIAVAALRRNAMRTALTALGLIIGVAAVIVMVAIGNGARSSIETPHPQRWHQCRDHLGRLERIRPGQAGRRRHHHAHSRQTRTRSHRTSRASATSRPERTPVSRSIAEASNWNTQIQGAGADLPAIRAWSMQYGSFFSSQDVQATAKVAVLGSVVRDQLFGPGTDPTGATIRIKNQPFRVVGVLTSKGQAAMGPDQDDTVIVPYHDRAEEAAGRHALAEHHPLDGRRRAVRSGLRCAPSLAAHASSARAGRARRLHRAKPRGDGHAC